MLCNYSQWLNLRCLVEIIFVLVICLSTVTVALEEIQNEIDDDTKKVINKYIDKIPDIDSQYVVNEDLSKTISHYFNGKIKTFPLYKISLKIDRNPVKIPWILSQTNETMSTVGAKEREYKYVTPEKIKSN